MFKIRLKSLREAKGLTQQEFANDFGISKGTIGMWESGAREPRKLIELQRIADYFGVTVDYLLGREDIKNELPAQDGELSKEESMLIELFRQVPPEQRSSMLQAIEMTLRSQGLL